MYIKKILVKNYKLFKDSLIELNPLINIFVGENDAGKSTILEVLSILTTGKLNGFVFERQLKASLFNDDIRKEYITSIRTGNYIALPKIVLEAYFEDCEPDYSGTNNELREDCSGIHVEVSISEQQSETYKRMLQDENVQDIPIELYHVTFTYFSGSIVSFRYAPFSSLFIDTTRRDYTNIIDRFVSDSITNHLTERELTDLSSAYRSSRQQFHDNDIVKRLNISVHEQVVIPGKDISIDLKEDSVDDWKKQMAIIVNQIPFENIGFGTQNAIKIELVIKNAAQQANIVIMEEPENNLSFSNMAVLVKHITNTVGKQVFISTHNSYIANKLSLGNVILVHNGKTSSYASLNKEAKNYFLKLPGYDTLRFVLAQKVILVEGPTDDLIIQRAYKDRYGRLPIEDGIDIIVVDALAFKRYCDIAVLMEKKIIIVTDNDGDIAHHITSKYVDYINNSLFSFVYEKNEELNTIEPSVLAVNLAEDGNPTATFKKVISSRDSMVNKTYSEVLRFMTNNKAEWALRVFESEESIHYPEYIKNVIEQCS